MVYVKFREQFTLPGTALEKTAAVIQRSAGEPWVQTVTLVEGRDGQSLAYHLVLIQMFKLAAEQMLNLPRYQILSTKGAFYPPGASRLGWPSSDQAKAYGSSR